MSRLIEALDARINPVWVKEVRQALRGKLFRIGYLATLMIAGLASLIAVAEPRERMGVGVFDVGFVALCVAIVGLVPFTAFYATPSEREAHSLDLVLISGLKPGQIARGRLLGAMTQAALFLCAFLPFMSLSAVLPGVDLLAALVALGSVVLYSAGASAASIALGLITRNRLVRALAGLWLSGVLMYLVMGAAVAGAQLLDRPESLYEDQMPLVMSMLLLPPVVLLVYGLGASSAAVAHPEENRSTPLRLATLAFTVIGCALIGLSAMGDPEAPQVGSLMLIVFLGFPLGVFLCEPDRMGRRVVRSLPDPIRAAIVSPFLPGGDRAGAMTLMLLGGVALVSLGAVHMAEPGASDLERFHRMLAVALSYGAVYLFIPPLLLRPWLGLPLVRWAATLAIPGLCLAGVLTPMLLGFFVSNLEWTRGRHMGNPFWVMGDMHSDWGTFLPVVALAALLVLVQVFRGLRGASDAYELAARRDRGA